MEKYKRKLTIHAGDQPYFVYTIQTKDEYKVLLDIKDIIEKISGLKRNLN